VNKLAVDIKRRFGRVKQRRVTFDLGLFLGLLVVAAVIYFALN